MAHRAQFHEALQIRAKELGVTIELSKEIVRYDELKGQVLLRDGSVVQGDLIVAANGKEAQTCLRRNLTLSRYQIVSS